ncbi:MAG: hypothetical protein FWF40_02615, partial [Methanomassiliicoccaceae archaeon]|nr:hypothetical protein [Methanomassiliicoccaceae archaeon]
AKEERGERDEDRPYVKVNSRPAMHILDFAEACDIVSKTEIERFALLCYFLVKEKNASQLSVRKVSGLYKGAGLDAPDKAALKEEIKNSGSFRPFGIEGTLRFSEAAFETLDTGYSHLWNSVAGVPAGSEVLDEERFCGKLEGFDRLVAQINSSYREGSHDACALTMRRLLEASMIFAFQSKGMEDAVRNGSGYLPLEDMIELIADTDALGLSGRMDDLSAAAEIGGYSGRGPAYTFSANDINSVRAAYREILGLLYGMS